MLRFTSIILAAVGLGCASNHYDTYTEGMVGWTPIGLTGGIGLHEALASLYAPPMGDYRRLISKLDVLRIDATNGLEKLGEQEVAAALEDFSGNYAVVATLDCRSSAGLERFYQQKVAWLLIRAGELVSWNSVEFADACVVISHFHPGPRELAELEREIEAYRDRNFPRSIVHTEQLYLMGLAYVAVDRIADAQRMLELADTSLDASPRGGLVRFERPARSVDVLTNSRASRQKLVDAIAEAMERTEAPKRTDPARQAFPLLGNFVP